MQSNRIDFLSVFLLCRRARGRVERSARHRIIKLLKVKDRIVHTYLNRHAPTPLGPESSSAMRDGDGVFFGNAKL